nr:immunoglobulin light chain junction region [Macaca mulatta]MOX50558.1 immunoglobulin light chain junction region [Macaca mulatta]
CQQGYNTPYNF